MLDSTQRTTAAELLWAAERDLAPIGPLTETFPGIDVVDAYEIQLINIRRKLADRRPGARPQGRPVLPGHAADDGRRRARLRSPARLDGAVAEDTPIPAGRYCYPRIEVEIGYVLGSRPARRGLHRGRRAGRDRVHRAEPRADRQPDHRLADQAGRHDRRQRLLGRGDPRRRAQDARRAGGGRRRPERHRRRAVPGGRRGGRPSAATPARCSATRPPASPGWRGRWPTSGSSSRPGTSILPGSCTRAIDARPGIDFRAEFAGLGTVTA